MAEPQPLDPDRVNDAVAALTRAFQDERHFRLTFRARREQALPHVMQLCVADGLAQGRVDTVSSDDGELVGVAVWLSPGAWPIGLRRRLRHVPAISRMVLAGGIPAGLRMLRFGDLTDRAHVRAPHWFVYVLGVDPAHHQRGHGRALLMQGLQIADRSGLPTFLETQEPSSVRWYTRYGFRLHGAPDEADGYTSWPMLRQPAPPNRPVAAQPSARPAVLLRPIVWAIVLAGGGGARFGGAKQYAELGGRPLVSWSIAAASEVAAGVVAVVPDPSQWPGPAVPGLRVVAGGTERADSVRAGLAAVPGDADVVVIADAAHPLAEPALFQAVVDAVCAGADAALPGLPLVEVLARVDDDGLRRGGLPRDGLVQVQTPQAFRADLLRRLHATRPAAAEDSALVGEAGGRVVVVPGQPTNLHVTTPDDLELARRLSPGAPSAPDGRRAPPTGASRRRRVHRAPER